MSRRRPRSRRERASTLQEQHEPIRRRTAPPPGRDERTLRERIQTFTFQDRFKGDFERAIRLYFGEEALQNNVFTVDEQALPGFQEWYFFDYATSGKERIIDLFAREVGPRLPAAQRQMFDDWRRVNRYRLFEVQRVEPGVGETLQDLLSGDVFELNDISASYGLTRWQIILARPIVTEGRWHFTGSTTSLPPTFKPDILDFARELWKKYQAQHPQASVDDFYRDRGLDLYRRIQEIASTPPTICTPEGHPVMGSTARYAVTDPDAVRERLDQTEEFVSVGPADEDRQALAYVWLLTGRSRVPEVPVERGLRLETNWMADEAEKETYRSLGDVRLWRDRLELLCLSRERLEAGKGLLQEILGRRFIRHLGDDFKDIVHETFQEPSSSRRRTRTLPRKEWALARQMAAEQLKEWPDTSIPALGGKSPRQAASDPAMREQLEEMLKAIEYTEEQKRRAGEPCMDIADLRRELGLPPR
jgi:hypothetical protein